MSHLPDQTLLKNFAASGDEAAFRVLVERYAGLVRGVALRRLGSGEAADDVAQEVFVLLARKAAQVAKQPSLAAWLHRAATWQASSMARGEQRRTRRQEMAAAEPSPAVSPDEEAEWSEVRTHLDAVLNALPEKDRSVLLMRLVEGLTYGEIASRLGLTEAAVQRRGHRAQEKTGRALERRGIRLNAGVLAAGVSGIFTLRAPAGLSARLAAQALRAGVPGMAAGGAGVILAKIAAVVLVGATCAWPLLRRAENPVTVAVAAPGLPPAGPTVARALPRTGGLLREGFPLTPPAGYEEFRKRALTDPAGALRWARAANPSSDRQFQFLPAAARFLAREYPEVADAVWAAASDNPEEQRLLERGIATGIALDDFAAGVAWLEARPGADSSGLDEELRNRDADEDTPEGIDLPAVLAVTRTPDLRTMLLRAECRRLERDNESGLAGFAGTLSGGERALVEARAALCGMSRGREDAWSALASALDSNPAGWALEGFSDVALQDPARAVEWLLARPERYRNALPDVWIAWVQEDAESARAWYAAHGPSLKSPDWGWFPDVSSGWLEQVRRARP